MNITFRGVRGSTPVSGSRMTRVGGDSSCVEVRAGGARLVLDAGTGLRGLGQELARGPVELVLALSHFHWDHVLGLPFFAPLFRPGNRITLVGPEGLRDALSTLMAAPGFPVALGDVGADLVFRTIRPGESHAIGGFHLHAAATDHPGGALAYRVDSDDTSLAYVTDHEAREGLSPALVDLARGVDLLIHDAQYLPADVAPGVRSKRGWGHSTWEEATALAEAADVGTLALYHHDPERTDRAVAQIERRAAVRFANTFAARAGKSVALGYDEAPDDPAGDARPSVGAVLR